MPNLPDLTALKMMMYPSVTFILKLKPRGKQLRNVVQSDIKSERNVWHVRQTLQLLLGSRIGIQVVNGMAKVVHLPMSCRPSYQLY
jgi:hypothetical protein